MDYKLGVDKRLTSPNCPIRRIDEVKSKVDESRNEIQTISTHRGMYCMNGLAIRIMTAPSEFNSIFDQIL